MILRRITENLKTQNWTAIAIELGIVILGVFIGTQVSNWNEGRLEKRETERLLLELRPAIEQRAHFHDAAIPYYATARRYSETAFAGWRGDSVVSDEQFVIAAYQASQIYVFGIEQGNWATIFGSDRLRQIDNVEVRRGLTEVMAFNYDHVDLAAIATPYREHVRQVIPEDIQDAIRAECTDKPIGGQLLFLHLPPTCDIDLPESRFAAGAAALRARPDLIGELRWHRAAVATFLANLNIIGGQTRRLQQALDESAK